MKAIQGRLWSFLIVAAVYLLAGACGIGVYLLMPGAFWLRLLIADAAATVLVFIFSVIFKNASVYDPYWSVQPIFILLCCLYGHKPGFAGVLMLMAVCYWGVRLTANWAYTFHGLGHQDWRYTMLQESSGKLYPFVNFTGIHMVPTLIVYLCTLPAAHVLRSGASANIGSWVFTLVSLGSATLQLIADWQMHSFRKKGQGGFIRTGFWQYARHPNYLGEILMWWGIGLATVCVLPDKWYLLTGALLNTLLFLFISIPMADRRQSRKPGWREYRRATRSLLPLKK